MLSGIIGLGLVAAAASIPCPRVTRSDALRMARAIGINWSRVAFRPEQLRKGIAVELEHGPCGPGGRATDVTHGVLVVSARIAYAHLLERADYYELLERYVEPRS